MKDEGLALLSFCGLEPAESRITAFSRPRKHMWLVQHMDWVTLLFPFWEMVGAHGAMIPLRQVSASPCWLSFQNFAPTPDIFFLGSLLPDLNIRHTLPLTPNTCHTLHTTYSQKGVGDESFIIFLVFGQCTPLLLVCQTCSHFPRHVQGLAGSCELCIHSSLPHLESCGVDSVAVMECNLGFLYRAIIPQVPQRPSVDMWSLKPCFYARTWKRCIQLAFGSECQLLLILCVFRM